MSMLPFSCDRNIPPQLRLWTPSDDDSRGISPAMTLSEFFTAWFLPVVLVGQQAAREGTLTLYRDAVRWWAQLTGDPPIAQIDVLLLAQFQAALRSAKYRRSPLGREYSLSQHSQQKILRNLRAIMYRLGPTTDPKRPAAQLLDGAPYLTLSKVRSRPKPIFSLDVAAQLVTATHQMAWTSHRHPPRFEPACSASEFSLGLLGSLYYLGFRAGTVPRLHESMLSSDARGTWITVPDADVTKTHRELRKYVHPDLVTLWRRTRGPSGELLAWPHTYGALHDWHDRLQRVAGLDQRLPMQAWRRTHATEMARVGARSGLLAAQHALDHGSADTTAGFYCDIEADLIDQLPRLVESRRVGWRNGFTSYPAPDLPLLPQGFLAQFGPAWGELLCDFEDKFPDLFGDAAFPKDVAKASEPWPSDRSWTNVGILCAACDAAWANASTRAKLVYGCVGEGAGNQFLTFVGHKDLPDPEALLARPDQLELPKRFDQTRAILSGILSAVRENSTPDRWERAFDCLEVAYDQQPESAMSAEGALWEIKPGGHMPKERNGAAAEMRQARLGV